MRYQRPKGTHDILPEDQPYWDYVRKTARALAERMGFERIDRRDGKHGLAVFVPFAAADRQAAS